MERVGSNGVGRIRGVERVGSSGLRRGWVMGWRALSGRIEERRNDGE